MAEDSLLGIRFFLLFLRVQIVSGPVGRVNVDVVADGVQVRAYIKQIFHYCDTVDHGELVRLMDAAYAKETFDISYPFCTEVSVIPPELSRRYWTATYVVRGKNVRVCNHWFDTPVSQSRPLFVQYLLSKKIVTEDELEKAPEAAKAAGSVKTRVNRTRKPRSNSRYKNSAIGNAQNLVVRNILSNLGQESFTEKDWAETKKFFSQRCAYCGKEDKLIMEHVIPTAGFRHSRGAKCLMILNITREA